MLSACCPFVVGYMETNYSEFTRKMSFRWSWRSSTVAFCFTNESLYQSSLEITKLYMIHPSASS